MSHPAILVEGLGKEYQLGEFEPYGTLRDVIVGFAHRLRRGMVDPRPARKSQILWALKDISFEVKQGDVVGIVGSNGAGKSTLLKILSRITEPTEGRVELRGRVGSLLEVGTGFHPELTGRENIYLNGAILGMTHAEINRRFDEIVAFSEIEHFLDTPVKRYSSGMYVRLAFAVAAHLEPEILIVDEVLAVGDQAFQNKCLGKISSVAHQGRTVLFVSHNMAAVQSLCNVSILLQAGTIRAIGKTQDVVGQYQSQMMPSENGRCSLINHSGRTAQSEPVMTSVEIRNETGAPVSMVPMGGSISVQVAFADYSRRFSPVLGLVIRNSYGAAILTVNNRFIPGFVFADRASAGAIQCHLNDLPLMPGVYRIDLYFGDQHSNFDVVRDAVSLEVTEHDVFGSGKLPSATMSQIFWRAKWSLETENSQAAIATNT